jgi:hypothetical protein
MQYFVLVYNRRTGDLRHEVFDESRSALRRRFELERTRTDPDVEIASFGAASLDDLRKTHSRYFQSVGELAIKGLPRALRPTG